MDVWFVRATCAMRSMLNEEDARLDRVHNALSDERADQLILFMKPIAGESERNIGEQRIDLVGTLAIDRLHQYARISEPIARAAGQQNLDPLGGRSPGQCIRPRRDGDLRQSERCGAIDVAIQ